MDAFDVEERLPRMEYMKDIPETIGNLDQDFDDLEQYPLVQQQQ